MMETISLSKELEDLGKPLGGGNVLGDGPGISRQRCTRSKVQHKRGVVTEACIKALLGAHKNTSLNRKSE